MTHLFIINPAAGSKNRTEEYREKIKAACDKRGLTYQIQISHAPGDCRKLARAAAETGGKYRIYACGGDGTLNEVVSGVMQLEDKPVIGYIPTGSTNDFATSIGLKKNMLNNAKIAVGGYKYKVDVGTFNQDRNFVYVVAFGAFTEVSYATPQKLKNVIGHPAYLIEGIKSLPSIKSHHMRFEFNDKVIEDDFIYDS